MIKITVENDYAIYTIEQKQDGLDIFAIADEFKKALICLDFKKDSVDQVIKTDEA